MKYFVVFLSILSFTMANEIIYPYRVSAELLKKYENNFAKIKKGMTKIKVIELMGEPIRQESIYEGAPSLLISKKRSKLPNRKVIGSSLMYLLQQEKEHGSVFGKNARWMVVKFNLENEVMYKQDSLEASLKRVSKHSYSVIGAKYNVPLLCKKALIYIEEAKKTGKINEDLSVALSFIDVCLPYYEVGLFKSELTILSTKLNDDSDKMKVNDLIKKLSQ